MKRRFTAIILFLLLLFTEAVSAAPEISAPCAVLMDADSGIVLFGKNENQKAYPASTTKIMTAILALENGDLSENVTVSHVAVNSISYDSSKAGLYEGETLSFKDIVYSLLICSANDSANVIAETVAGDIDTFVGMMNEKATALGAVNTHFVNAHGLHNDNHYTTAYDLALIARYAMTLPTFREIVSMQSYDIMPTDKFEEVRHFNSTNHLLNPSSSYYFADAVGIKTGYTDDAKSCLVSAADYMGKTYIAVVLGAETSEEGRTLSFDDSRILLSYGENSCPPETIVKAGDAFRDVPVAHAKGTGAVPVHAADDALIILPEGVEKDALEKREYIKKDVEAPIQKDDILGRVEYWYGDMKMTEVSLVADADTERAGWFADILRTLFSSVIFWAVLAVLLIILLIRRIKRIQRRSQRRRRSEMRRKNKYR